MTTANAPTVWSKDDVTVSLTATDSGSGVAQTLYFVNGGDYAEGTTVTVSTEGVNKVSFYSVDQAGNAEAPQTVEVKIDRTAPVTAANAPTGWSKDGVTVNLTATDSGSGVAKTYYSVNGGDYAEGTSVIVSTEGVNKVAFYSVDQAGNAEAPHTVEVKIDRTAPVTAANAPTGWSKDDVTVNLAATDSGSGVAKTYYSVNGGDYVEGTTVTVSTEGVNKVAFYSVDQAGNAEAPQTVEVKIDRTAPVTTANAPTGWSKDDVTVSLAATDSGSGVAKTYYSVNGWDYVVGATVTVSSEGVNKVAFYSIDQAGNAEQAQTAEVKIDHTTPVTAANAPTSWSKDDVTVNLSAIDSGSGVAKTYYSVNGGDYVEGTALIVSTEGTNQVSFYSIDIAGNKETAKTVSVQIDKTAPIITMDLNTEYKLGSSVQGRQVKSCHLAGGNPAWKDSSQVTNSESWSGKGNLAV